MSIKNILKEQVFFSSLNEEQLEQIVSITSLHEYEKEYMLYYEQEKSPYLYFLVKGLAKAYKIDKHNNETFLYYMHENSMLSDISDFHTTTLNSFSNITFVEKSQVLQINYKKFKEMFLSKNILCHEFTNAIIEHSLQLQSLINRELIFDAVSKVSMMLHNDLKMFNKLKRHDISLMLYIQPATLSRVLNRLKRDNIITIIHGEVIILDEKKLEAIYKDNTDE